uniref:Uncharacterized protein n=1 Tax=Arundo donax TaxID=35708 RepID=A0A0A8Y3K4_ARUDO
MKRTMPSYVQGVSMLFNFAPSASKHKTKLELQNLFLAANSSDRLEIQNTPKSVAAAKSKNNTPPSSPTSFSDR